MNTFLVTAAVLGSLAAGTVSLAAPIHDASEDGDVAAVRRLLDADPKLINSRDNGNRFQPIHCAALRGRVEVVQLLIDRGADVEAVDGIEWRPIIHAVMGENIETVKLLLKYHANVNAVETLFGQTPLMFAAAHNQDNIYDLLIKNGADISILAKDRSHALHRAARGGSTHIIEELLAAKVDVDIRDKVGETPLMEAARYERKDAVAFLLKHGANVNATDKYGSTPLYEAVDHEALKHEHWPVTELLLANKADISCVSELSGPLLARTAINNSNIAFADFLLANGAKVNSATQDGATALDAAIGHGQVEMVKWLASKGADLNAHSRNYGTPLDRATALAKKGDPIRLKVVETLTALGAKRSSELKSTTQP